MRYNQNISRLPAGFYSRSLSNIDVIKANTEWPFNHPGSLYYLQRLAHLNPSCGIFTKTDNALVSFAFQLVFSEICFTNCVFFFQS